MAAQHRSSSKSPLQQHHARKSRLANRGLYRGGAGLTRPVRVGVAERYPAADLLESKALSLANESAPLYNFFDGFIVAKPNKE